MVDIHRNTSLQMVCIRIKESQVLRRKFMTLKNVEVIEQQQHEKSWFQKFRSKFNNKTATTALIVSGSAVALPAHAEVPDFLAGATTSVAGIATGLGALFVAAIGIYLLIMAFSASKGGIKRAG